MTNITKLKKIFGSKFYSCFPIAWICHLMRKKNISLVITVLIIYGLLATFTSLFEVSYTKKFSKAYVNFRDNVISRLLKNFTIENSVVEQSFDVHNQRDYREKSDSFFIDETSNTMVLDADKSYRHKKFFNEKKYFNNNRNTTTFAVQSKKITNNSIVQSQGVVIEKFETKLQQPLPVLEHNKNLTIAETTPSSFEKQVEGKLLLKQTKLELKDLQNSSPFYYPVPLGEPQNKGVIILTNYRSGSTFLGEIFNQHLNAFYIFEPLLPFSGRCTEYLSEKIQLLNRFLKCDFPSAVEIFSQANFESIGNHIKRKCLRDDFCFRTKTKELCHRSLCYLPTYICKKCGPVPLSQAMNVCRKKKLSVVKLIRFCDILDLKPILEDSTLDVKVIHLVRDPRGIESSRLKLHSDWSIYADAKKTCERLLSNALNGKNILNRTHWLKNRYMEVRYEDLSLKPHKIAREILNFVGLDYNNEIQDWIMKNTRISPLETQRFNPYSTKRNSTSTMQAWRSHLNFDQVRNIQNVCKETMHHFGYQMVSNKTELNNTNFLLLKNLP